MVEGIEEISFQFKVKLLKNREDLRCANIAPVNTRAEQNPARRCAEITWARCREAGRFEVNKSICAQIAAEMAVLSVT